MAILHVFPDTNNFLHYRSVQEVDFPKLLRADSVVLVIAPVTVRELNEQKDRNAVAKLRKRAASALRVLGGYLRSGTPADVRHGVTLIFQAKEAVGVDFDADDLARHSADDHLIAAALQYQLDNPGADVALLTNDIGLIAKAMTKSLRYFELPEQYQLPDEPDPAEAKASQLEAQLRKLQRNLPELKVLFQNGDTVQHVILKPQEISSEKLKAELEKEKACNPLVTEDLNIPQMGIRRPNWRSPEEVKARNAELQTYYQDFENYLQAKREYTNRSHRRFTVELEVVNSGGAPAEDVDVFLAFPPGITLYVKADAVPDPPPRPKAPADAVSALHDQMQMIMRPFGSGYDRAAIASARYHWNRNVSDLWISGDEVRGNIQNVKHRTSNVLPVFVAEFDSPEAIRSFSIEYTLLAANHPEKFESTLNVVIQTQPTESDTGADPHAMSFEL